MNTIRLINASLLVLIALATCVPLAWSVAPEPAIRIEPASIQANAGDTVQVTVEIRDVTNLGGFQFDLIYDPAIVQVDSVALGDFAGSTGRSVNPLGPKIEAGKAVYGAFSFGDTAGPDGSGILATIMLKAKAGGQTFLKLQNAQVVDTGGTRISVSTEEATMIVSGTPPAPGERSPAAAAGTPTRISTRTAATVLPSPQPDAISETAPASPLADWAIVGAVLIAVLALVALAAYRMTR